MEHPQQGNLHLPKSHFPHKPHNPNPQPHTHSHHAHHESHAIHQHADYNYFTAEDGNIVWAGALTLAWKELLRLADNAKQFTILGHPQLQSIADNFNHSAFSCKDLNPNSYYVRSGHGQETVDLINKERGEKFKECTFPPINAQLSPSAIISYAYLYKKVMYPYKFTKAKHANFTFKSVKGEKKV
jgi:hypothetical protein